MGCPRNRGIFRIWDTIITFNYDQVLENLATQNGPITLDSFVRPDRAGVPTNDSVRVLKVHGSTNWGVNDEGASKIVDNIEFFTKSGGFKPLIATPGATKTNYCNTYLQPLWNAAVDALRMAEVIVFLGYRFPPSDSEARERILRGIAENHTANRLIIHTVLGPRIHDDATVRLTGLLKHTVKGANRLENGRPSYAIINQPLYVEDFLSVMTHQTLVPDF